MAVQMNRVVGHGEVRDPDAHAVAESHRKHVDPRKHPRVECPNIEVSHLSDLGERGAGIETVKRNFWLASTDLSG
jgi:hypothetical protein